MARICPAAVELEGATQSSTRGTGNHLTTSQDCGRALTGRSAGRASVCSANGCGTVCGAGAPRGCSRNARSSRARCSASRRRAASCRPRWWSRPRTSTGPCARRARWSNPSAAPGRGGRPLAAPALRRSAGRAPRGAACARRAHAATSCRHAESHQPAASAMHKLGRLHLAFTFGHRNRRACYKPREESEGVRAATLCARPGCSASGHLGERGRRVHDRRRERALRQLGRLLRAALRLQRGLPRAPRRVHLGHQRPRLLRAQRAVCGSLRRRERSTA